VEDTMIFKIRYPFLLGWIKSGFFAFDAIPQNDE
jgi:hypothetical protein